MAVAAWSSTVKIPGTSTAIVDEPTTLQSATVFQITNTAKRVLDPTVAMTVKANSVVQASSAYTVDPLFGTITFGSAPTAPVTISCSYLPMLTYAEVREASLELSRTMLDKTSFDSAGARSRLPGLKVWSGSVTAYSSPFYDHDPGAGVRQIVGAFDGGNPILLEILPGGSGQFFRGWGLATKHAEKMSLDGLVELTLTFDGSAQAIAGAPNGTSFAFGN